MAQSPHTPNSGYDTQSIAQIEGLLRNNNPAAARPLCKKLCKKNGSNPQAWFLMSAIHAQLGEYSDAARCCREVIKRVPGLPTAHYNCALALHKLGQPEAAITCLRETIRLQPDFIKAYIDIGDILKAARQYDQAIEIYQAALDVDPAHREIHEKIAYTQLLREDTDAAIKAYKKLAQLTPADVNTWQLMVRILASRGTLDEAESICTQALEANPDNVALLCELGKIISEQGDANRAAHIFRKARAIEPDNAEIDYLIAAFERDKASYIDKQAYIARVFDDYAESFDTHLAKQLEYHIPELIHQVVLECITEDQGAMDILDLGCGTGLCGVLFQNMANSLTGVDLSPRMIEKARQRATYSALHQADIIDTLEQSANAYDLALAADVFVYVGNLSTVFAGCSKTLRAGGMLVFSVESVDGDSYRLRASGRYGHSTYYILDMATRNDLVVRTMRETTIRKEGTRAIPGQVFVLVKSPCNNPGAIHGE